ncbi:hypothetical protein ACHAC9_05700 [Massilia sp. CMS3.1]|uniref:hypothetical protein n=1 Tax=Massilia sp. CMS3.1 TaxID=3373083 RepID=UPI003EE49D89
MRWTGGLQTNRFIHAAPDVCCNSDLTVGGNLNNFWVGAAQAGGTVTVGGASNTFVFKPSATPATATVTGSANTFYFPEG